MTGFWKNIISQLDIDFLWGYKKNKQKNYKKDDPPTEMQPDKSLCFRALEFWCERVENLVLHSCLGQYRLVYKVN